VECWCIGTRSREQDGQLLAVGDHWNFRPSHGGETIHQRGAVGQSQQVAGGGRYCPTAGTGIAEEEGTEAEIVCLKMAKLANFPLHSSRQQELGIGMAIGVVTDRNIPPLFSPQPWWTVKDTRSNQRPCFLFSFRIAAHYFLHTCIYFSTSLFPSGTFQLSHFLAQIRGTLELSCLLSYYFNKDKKIRS